MKRTKIGLVLSLATVLSLASCTIEFSNPFNVGIYASNSEEVFANGKSYFQNIMSNKGMETMPSIGNSKMLVVPIVFANDIYQTISDSVDWNDVRNDINTCFFGTSADTNYWESVSSFYNKSSYGNLNLTGTVGDFVYVDNSVSQYQKEINDGDKKVTDITNSFLEQAYSQYFENGNLNYTDYDSDNDGYIDDVFLVYCSPYNPNDSTNLLWAYTYWDTNATAKHVKTYSWASYNFMKEGTNTGIDAHTFIHETGHAMGLDDYYSYDDGNTREPLGRLDMMDFNILDHNAFSKYNLGWITPVVADYNKTYALKPFQDSGDALILANNFNGTCFDEFLIISYYTPTGLNALDSSTAYAGFPIKGFEQPGIKVIHVDQRLGKFTYSDTRKAFLWDGGHEDNPSDEKMDDAFYEVLNSNTKSYCYENDSFALASLVQASGQTNLMDDIADSRIASDDDLFTTTSKQLGDTVFPNFTFDDSTTVPAKMNITSLDSNGATITFTQK